MSDVSQGGVSIKEGPIKENHVTHRRMQIVDINSGYFGVSRETLMENAGRQAFLEIKDRFKFKTVVIFCGTGNNGGDGLVIARYLHDDGKDVRVIFTCGVPKTPEAQKNFLKIKDRVETSSFEKMPVKTPITADLIVDAILGTGIKGELREPVKSAVDLINNSKAPKVSIDVPTGLDSDTGKGECVRADLVVTFHKMKKGLERSKRFEVTVKDIGVPEEAETHAGPGDVIFNLKTRKEDSHKGDHGRVIIVGGSDLFYGAPILAGMGALNSGADLVCLVVPEVNFEITRCHLPDFIVRKYPGDFLNENAVDAVLKLSEGVDAMVIGPGLGTREETLNAVTSILNGIEVPVVVDADAIKAVKPPIKNAIITPHSGEFESLTGEKPCLETVLDCAKKFDSVIIQKSAVDIMASQNGQYRYNSTGNPGMTVGGTGDVLAGVTAGLIAQGVDLFESALCSSFITGFCGGELEKRKGYCYTATDVAEEIPFTIRKILRYGFSYLIFTPDTASPRL